MKRVEQRVAAGQCDRPAAMLARFVCSDAEIPAEDEQTTAQERRAEREKQAEQHTPIRSRRSSHPPEDWEGPAPPAPAPSDSPPTPAALPSGQRPLSPDETRAAIAAIRVRLASKMSMPDAAPVQEGDAQP